jgi:hypothetical protein
MKFKVGDLVDIEEESFYGTVTTRPLNGWRVAWVRPEATYPYVIKLDEFTDKYPVMEHEIRPSVVSMENE